MLFVDMTLRARYWLSDDDEFRENNTEMNPTLSEVFNHYNIKTKNMVYFHLESQAIHIDLNQRLSEVVCPLIVTYKQKNKSILNIYE